MEAIAEVIELEVIIEVIEIKVIVPVFTRNKEVNVLYIKLKDITPGTIPLKNSKSLGKSL